MRLARFRNGIHPAPSFRGVMYGVLFSWGPGLFSWGRGLGIRGYPSPAFTSACFPASLHRARRFGSDVASETVFWRGGLCRCLCEVFGSLHAKREMHIPGFLDMTQSFEIILYKAIPMFIGRRGSEMAWDFGCSTGVNFRLQRAVVLYCLGSQISRCALMTLHLPTSKASLPELDDLRRAGLS